MFSSSRLSNTELHGLYNLSDQVFLHTLTHFLRGHIGRSFEDIGDLRVRSLRQKTGTRRVAPVVLNG
jgi:hypothetical protein